MDRSDSNGQFKSYMRLNEIDFTFVGYYYCIKNLSKDYEMTYLLQTKQASRIYLFVDGNFDQKFVTFWRITLFHFRSKTHNCSCRSSSIE